MRAGTARVRHCSKHISQPAPRTSLPADTRCQRTSCSGERPCKWPNGILAILKHLLVYNCTVLVLKGVETTPTYFKKTLTSSSMSNISKHHVERILSALCDALKSKTCTSVDAKEMYSIIVRHTLGSLRVSDLQQAWKNAQTSFATSSASWQLLQFCHMYSSRMMLRRSKTSLKKVAEKHAVNSWRTFKFRFRRENACHLRRLQPAVEKENRGPPS